MSIGDNSILQTWKVLTALGIVIGLLLISLSLYYLSLYFIEAENSHRHEYLAGMAMAVMFSIPFWFLTTFLMLKNRNSISKIVFIPTVIITIILCLLFIAGVASPLYLN